MTSSSDDVQRNSSRAAATALSRGCQPTGDSVKERFSRAAATSLANPSDAAAARLVEYLEPVSVGSRPRLSYYAAGRLAGNHETCIRGLAPTAKPSRRSAAVVLLACVFCGCSDRPGRIATPSVDAEEATQAALELYDRDKDGMLNSEELKASPPLVDALPVYDTNHDGSLAQAELVAGVESWRKRGIGATVLPFTVRLDGRPLLGAEVKLVPAPFLGDAIAPAAGVADQAGSGSLEIAPENRPANVPKNLPVVQPGLYLVEITHPTVAVPEIYNTASTLGLEAGIAGQNPSGVVWELSSKKK